MNHMDYPGLTTGRSVQRHAAEKMSGMKVFGALVILLEILGLDVGVSRLGLTLLMTLPNSRAMESEGERSLALWGHPFFSTLSQRFHSR